MNQRIETIVNTLDSKKAENIQVFNMKEQEYIVNDVVIATTLGQKHGYALLDYLKPQLKKIGETILHTDESEEWIVIDLGDLLIHLMSPESRSKYNLEEFLLNYQQERG